MLKFAVCGQALAVMQPVVAADTIDYLEATFMFSSDWDGAVKVAHFRQGNNVYNVSLVDDKIRKEDHLNLSAGRWWVSVHGNVGDSRITTQEKPLVVEKSGVLEGEPLPDLPLTTAEKLTNEVAALREDVPDPEGVAEDWVLTPGGWQPQKDGLGLPTPTAEDAGKVPVVKEDGSGYELGEVAGGSTAGKDGGYYTPTVDEAGNLTWTASKADMPTVDGANIKGPQGEQGPQGPAGAPGPAGPTPNIQIGTVDTLPAGSAATATMGGTPENPTLNLGIPQGVPGSGGGVHTFRHIQTITIPENEEIVKIDFTIPAKTRKLYVVAQTNSSSTFGSIVRFNVRNGNVFLAALNVQQSMEHRKALFSAELYDDIQFASFASSNAIFATPYPGYATFNDYASYFPVADNTLSIFIYGSSSTNNFFIAGSTFDLYALCEE